MHLTRKEITIDKKVGSETSQILIEGDIIVPDTKPDIDTILKTTANSYIDSKEIANEKINFKGNLGIHMLYIAKGEHKPIYSMQTNVPINDFINMEGIDKNMTVFTSCKITNVEHKIINDRKVSFRVIIDVCGEVFSKDRFETVTNIEELPESQMKKCNFNFNKIVCAKFDRFIIKDDIQVPSGYPNISDILQCDISFNNKEIKVSNDKVNISGDLKVCALYKGIDGEGIIEYFEDTIPFSGSLETEGSLENMDSDIYLDIQDKNVQIYNDSDGEPRVIGIEIYVGCNIKISFEDEFEMLEDAYTLDKTLEISKNNICYPSLVCKNQNQVNLKEVFKFDDNCPSILQIVKADGNVIVDDIKVIDDKVVVEGIVDCNILYITNNDDAPMHCYNTILPYQQVIETKGSNSNSLAQVNSSLENIGINMLSDKEVEVRCLLSFDTCVINEKEIGFIIDVIFNDLDEEFLNNIGSMTIYVVQKGDTLWKLAKRFNTTVEDIVEINDIENPDLIYPGERLLILKRVC